MGGAYTGGRHSSSDSTLNSKKSMNSSERRRAGKIGLILLLLIGALLIAFGIGILVYFLLMEGELIFRFLSSNIPSSPAYGVFISQLIRYARACSSYEYFILRAVRLSNKRLGQGYVKERLRSSLRKFYGRYGDLIKQYEVLLSRMLHDILDDDHIQ